MKTTSVRYCILVLWALLAGASGLRAEEPVKIVGARFEPANVLIGDHFNLIMEVETDGQHAIAFPKITPEFTEGRIELLKDEAVDTLESGRGAYRLRKSYRLICFEPAAYHIDSLGLLYTDGVTTDTLFAPEALELTVALMPVDTAQKSIYDIKQPLDAPLVVEEFSGYMTWALLLASVVASFVWLIVSRKRHHKATEAPLPKEPAHVVAIRSLEILANQKLWQNGKVKEYYSRLTEILREYLSGRYGVGAMEMTTDEIVAEMKRVSITPARAAELGALLAESDLVKFAKHHPDEEMHESAYNLVYYFVEESKEVAEEKREEPAEKEQIVVEQEQPTKEKNESQE